MNVNCHFTVLSVVLLGATPLLAQQSTVDASVLLHVRQEADLSAPTTGMLKASLVDEGRAVDKGDLLVQIDDAEAEMARQRAAIEVEMMKQEIENDVPIRIAEKTLAVAKSELQRGVSLKSQFADGISQSEIDRLRLEADRAALQLEQAQKEKNLAALSLRLKQSELAAAELTVAQHKVLAPFSGVVAKVIRKEGEWITSGEPLVRLIRIDRLYAEGFVNIAQAARIQEGQPVQLAVPGANGKPTSFTGRVDLVGLEVDPVDGQVRLRAEIDNSDRLLRPGQKGTLSVLPGASVTP